MTTLLLPLVTFIPLYPSASLFLPVLLDNGSRALSLPKCQRRCHPAVIRWCLQQQTRSTTGYEEMQQASYLRLPTSRTCRTMQLFSEPESGWHGEVLQTTVSQFKEHETTPDAAVGMLVSMRMTPYLMPKKTSRNLGRCEQRIELR